MTSDNSKIACTWLGTWQARPKEPANRGPIERANVEMGSSRLATAAHQAFVARVIHHRSRLDHKY